MNIGNEETSNKWHQVKRLNSWVEHIQEKRNMANLMAMVIGQRKKVFKMGSMKDGGFEEGQDMVFYLEKKGYM